MKSTFVAVLIGLSVMRPGLAETRLEIESTTNADIYLDGTPIGRAPLSFRTSDPGHHIVRIVDPGDRLEQKFEFDELVGESVRRFLVADFTTGSLHESVLSRTDTITP